MLELVLLDVPVSEIMMMVAMSVSSVLRLPLLFVVLVGILLTISTTTKGDVDRSLKQFEQYDVRSIIGV